jgi:hypothetical protein
VSIKSKAALISFFDSASGMAISAFASLAVALLTREASGWSQTYHSAEIVDGRNVCDGARDRGPPEHRNLLTITFCAL